MTDESDWRRGWINCHTFAISCDWEKEEDRTADSATPFVFGPFTEDEVKRALECLEYHYNDPDPVNPDDKRKMVGTVIPLIGGLDGLIRFMSF